MLNFAEAPNRVPAVFQLMRGTLLPGELLLELLRMAEDASCLEETSDVKTDIKSDEMG